MRWRAGTLAHLGTQDARRCNQGKQCGGYQTKTNWTHKHSITTLQSHFRVHRRELKETLERDLNIRLHRDICHLRAEAIQELAERPRQTAHGVTCLGGTWLFSKNEHLTCHKTDKPGGHYAKTSPSHTDHSISLRTDARKGGCD